MAAVPVTLVGTTFTPTGPVPTQFTGYAYVTGAGGSGGPPTGIWGPVNTPDQGLPGAQPLPGQGLPSGGLGGGGGGGNHPGHPISPGGERPDQGLPKPPPPFPDAPPEGNKPPPPGGGWGYSTEFGWGYFPNPEGGKPQPLPPSTPPATPKK
jgi:hypothetical protein